MLNMKIAHRTLLAAGCLFVLLAGFAPTAALAQSSGLTSDQQRMLDQLPPAQRQLVLDRINAGASSPASATVNADRSGATGAALATDSPETAADVFASHASLLVMPSFKDERPSDAVRELKRRIEAGNPYRLDANGVLFLPGSGGIPLAGLDEELATLRLEADPNLSGLQINLRLLPIQQFGVAALEPYGYNVFKNGAAPGRDAVLPAPADYVVGPGDTIRVQLFGTQNAFYVLAVERDGTVNFPELGPISVAGLSFDGVREEIVRRVREQITGTEVSVTLGELRSIQVFLAGDVENPGTYIVSAQSTMLDVLAAGGGIAMSGSLRNIQLRRKNQTVVTFDLYQLLLFGDASANRRVAAGDVIFVAPVGGQVAVVGEVQRPAIYEIRNKLDTDGLLLLAGGATARAHLTGARLERDDPARGLAVIELDLTSASERRTPLHDGDALIIPGDTDQVDRAVSLIGHVYRPGSYEWHSGLRLSELLPSRDSLRPDADPHYVLIKRRATANGPIEIFSADMAAIWGGAGGADDPRLQTRDEIYVFSLIDGRSLYLAPIVETLRRQSSSEQPSPLVMVGGLVKTPGNYPLEAGMTVSDLIRAGGGLAESAYRQSAELSRQTTDGISARESRLIEIDLAAILAGDVTADLILAPFDHLNIKQITRWENDALVEIKGEVAFPGKYPISKGETLSSVIERAGGLAEFAFAQGSVFTRQILKEREREQLDALAARIESDLASMALSDNAQTEAVSIGRSLLDQIESTEPAGRLVIDLDRVVAGEEGRDIFLRDGDSLFVPPRAQEVTVIGEVQYATSHLWEEGLNRDEYIRRSGGVTVKADSKRIYVVRANGEVVASNRSRFFSRSRAFDIRPGDTVVVPLDTHRVKPLVVWSSATQIIYNLAIAAAAVNSF